MRDDAQLDVQFHVVPLPKWAREVTIKFNVAHFSVYSQHSHIGLSQWEALRSTRSEIH